MRPTRPLWAVGLLAVMLAVFSILFAQPALLFGPALIGAWILVRQFHFLLLLSATLEGLRIEQTPAASVVHTEELLPVRLSVRRADPVPIQVSVEAGVPPAGRRDDPLEVTLAPGDIQHDRTMSVTWPIAGRHQFAPAAVVATDGWFRQTFSIETTPIVTVEPRAPKTVHIGAGGKQLATTHGDHRAGWLMSSTEVDTIREYMPGEPAKRIDWNATARLATPHIQEFEKKTDRPTLLVVDVREDLRRGTPAETKLDYLREAALTLTSGAQRCNDPLGIATLDDNGLYSQVDPEASTRAYRRVRRELFELGKTHTAHHRSGKQRTAPPAPQTTAVSDGGTAALTQSRVPPDPVGTNGASTESAERFVEVLRPFYEVQIGRKTATANSFVGGVESVLRGRDRQLWTVICTDDSAPQTLRDAVSTLRKRGHHVLVLLTPTVLFEDNGLADLDAAYDRYVTFEEFRRDLDRTEGVRALEVTPDDRLAAVLATGRNHRRGDIR